MSDALYRVVAVNILTGDRRVLTENKTEENTEAHINMAIARRGVDVEYYTIEKQSALPLEPGEGGM